MQSRVRLPLLTLLLLAGCDRLLPFRAALPALERPAEQSADRSVDHPADRLAEVAKRDVNVAALEAGRLDNKTTEKAPIVGWQLVPATTTGLPAGASLYDVGGNGAKDLYVVGSVPTDGGLSGIVLHYGDNGWKMKLQGSQPLRSVARFGAGEALVVGAGSTALRCSAWPNLTCADACAIWFPATGGDLRGVGAVDPSSGALLVGASGTDGAVFQYDAVSKKCNLVHSMLNQLFRGVWGTSPLDATVVGKAGTVVTRVKGTFSTSSPATQTFAPPLHDIWGSGNGLVAVGGFTATPYTTFGIFDSPAWAVSPGAGGIGPPGANLNGLWTDGSLYYAVGDNYTVLRRDAKAYAYWWQRVTGLPPSSTGANLRAVWASSPTDVWIVGDNSTILHYGSF